MSLFRCFLWPIVLLAFLLCSLNIASVTVFEHWNRGAFPSTPITATRASTSQQDETDDSTALLKAYPSDKWEPVPRPPLLSIVQGWNISGDASWLLQFSIVGFPKCGTSTLMFHLRSHSQVQMFQDERCELGSNQHARLIQDLYRQFPPLPSTADAENLKPRFVRGIKCPSDLETTKLSMRNYRTVFPRTDFVVGVRHPVLWFESFYNFRIQNRFEMPPAETLIGRCRKGWNFVCTYRSNFHIFLSNFGKTNMTTSTTEQQYVDEAYRKTMDPVPTTRRVFLYDVSQLSDSNEQRANQFRTDLQHYLHLTNPIDPFIWFKPGRNHSTDHAKGKERGLFQTSTATTRPSSVGSSLRKIDICDERYNHLRSVLMHHAVQSSRWMRRYFVHANGVVVSSKDYFANSLLTSWEQDPCAARRLNSTA